MFLLYGTLLGLVRSGDFIPGDDDFDVGYVSEATSPEAVKQEAMDIIRFFVGQGFKVLVNRFGKPFRLTLPGAAAGVHLDVRPVWSPGDGHVWLHKSAHLQMDLEEFRSVLPDTLRGTEVWKPAGTERFLAAYYGASWRTPDPAFSNSGKVTPKAVLDGLAACCLNRQDQLALRDEAAALSAGHGGKGEFVPISLEPLYPLEVYKQRVGE